MFWILWVQENILLKLISPARCTALNASTGRFKHEPTCFSSAARLLFLLGAADPEENREATNKGCPWLVGAQETFSPFCVLVVCYFFPSCIFFISLQNEPRWLDISKGRAAIVSPEPRAPGKWK